MIIPVSVKIVNICGTTAAVVHGYILYASNNYGVMLNGENYVRLSKTNIGKQLHISRKVVNKAINDLKSYGFLKLYKKIPKQQVTFFHAKDIEEENGRQNSL